ncbi:cilia- and flagella-associated protein 251-like [Salvelinus fontinalis]|uniref:cilia- and flagella-associated protein 251-like n=1 Tax=Salvelinus fontinalis TaxID=8038 RepID=UPI0024861133|nr:cilia- and flagella-associated protein 251-like isoform X2 [Salvelinus fontinalis]XP_055769878.1 cilia- and flagella-associated protein 251-like [Salvelinus fontinalis]XP_055771207.1 cilia- and flagella-associated protein 251-like isoform X2 [Salvelinus fontinalis]XP_055772788.1 cilia- and flagella-associated protein 251-like isoform X2 [Salvelinus fontinalis]XP_055773239.1 cilia- and flagella-associated protein 251-like [Salvelinus fontinalis]
MSSLNYSLPAEEETVCWTEKEALIKEEEEEKDVTIQKQVEGEAVTGKEEKDVTVKEEAFRVKEEEGVTVKDEEVSVFEVKAEEGENTVKSEEEEEEEETVTIQKQVEGEVVTLKEEEKDVSVKEEEEGEITVSSEEEDEETGYLGPISQTQFKASSGSKDELSHKMVLRNRAVITTAHPEENKLFPIYLLLPAFIHSDVAGNRLHKQCATYIWSANVSYHFY